jgi:hypothetical protein
MDPTLISPLKRVRKETRMSDHFPDEPGQDHAALSRNLAQLDELLLTEGQRWRGVEPSTVRLERYVQALARRGVTIPRNEERMLSERNQAPVTSPTRPTPQRLPSRWRGPLAAVATVLLVAMAASVFAFMSARRVGTGTGKQDVKATPTSGITRVTAIQPPNTFLPMPKNAYLSGISFSSAYDGWAVGGIRIPDFAGQDFSTARGVLVHYHDGVWTEAKDGFPGIELFSVSMVSANDGWAIGSSVLNAAIDGSGAAALLHYTGGHWVMVKTSALANTHPSTIRMLSPDFGYITGEVDVTNANKSIDQVAFVAVYQNGVWKAIRTPFEAFTSQVVMVSAGEGWAVANENWEGGVYHYLNGVWVKALAFPGVTDSISIASGVDVWALGHSSCSPSMTRCSPNRYVPVIYHFNGSGWSRMKSPNVVGVTLNNLIQPTIFDEAANGVWLPLVSQDPSQPPSQRPYTTMMWVYGMNGNDTWLPVSQPVKGGGVFTLTADGNGGVWAIVQTDTPFGTTILYSQGQDWKVYGRSR